MVFQWVFFGRVNLSGSVHILWTGGWDSSFRVLYLVLVEKRNVSPHYLIDLGRQSSLSELSAIARIKNRLYEIDPAAAERVGALKLCSVPEIPENYEITKQFEKLRSRAHLGSQYDWLSRYAESEGLDGLELSVHADDKASGFLAGHVEKNKDGGWVLSSKARDLGIFSRFRFPLFLMTKREMATVAENEGFREIMDLSWFCYRPRAGRPCGTCNPCVYTIEEGLTERFSSRALFWYKLGRRKRAIKKKVKAFLHG